MPSAFPMQLKKSQPIAAAAAPSIHVPKEDQIALSREVLAGVLSLYAGDKHHEANPIMKKIMTGASKENISQMIAKFCSKVQTDLIMAWQDWRGENAQTDIAMCKERSGVISSIAALRKSRNKDELLMTGLKEKRAHWDRVINRFRSDVHNKQKDNLEILQEHVFTDQVVEIMTNELVKGTTSLRTEPPTHRALELYNSSIFS